MLEEDTILLVIDLQERLISAINNNSLTIKNIEKLVASANILGISIIFSEQNPDKLGKTIKSVLGDKFTKTYNKMSFSCSGNEELLEEIKSEKKKNIVIAGIESHVCVQQSCLDLIDQGYRTYVIADATNSRNPIDHEIALRRLESNGACITTAESAIFEWCKTADRKEFKAISKLIKEPIN
tara:strand:+ start:2743 stop:3288 length:546 start_codon:yes stop_codon:yes gene_type:complete